MTYKIAYFETVDELDDLLVAVYDHKPDELEKALSSGADVNRIFHISASTKITMLELAVSRNDVEIAKLLLKYGANVSVLTAELAARFCERKMLYLLKKDLAYLGYNAKCELFRQAIYGLKVDNIDVLDDFGISVKTYGANAFKHAIFKTTHGTDDEERLAARRFVKEFLRMNVNINDNSYDIVFSDCATPLIVAVECRNFVLAKELIRKGADVMACNRYGERAYIIALQKKEAEFADYLYHVEPHPVFERREKEILYEPYRMPDSLRTYLKGKNRIFTYEIKGISLNTIEFLPFDELIPMKYDNKSYLRISLNTNDYWFFILWQPKNQTIVCLDPEHETITELGSWEMFIENPIKKICEKYFEMRI